MSGTYIGLRRRDAGLEATSLHAMQDLICAATLLRQALRILFGMVRHAYCSIRSARYMRATLVEKQLKVISSMPGIFSSAARTARTATAAASCGG